VSLLGWRQWVVDSDGLLRPAWTPWSPFPAGLLLWPPDGMAEAHCLRAEPSPGRSSGRSSGRLSVSKDRPAAGRQPDGGHEHVPDERCVCGLYAWRTPALLRSARPPRWTSLPCVVGVVRLGGRTIVAERGYRAQRGFPVAVLDPHGVVSPRYTVARYRHWDALVAEWHEP